MRGRLPGATEGSGVWFTVGGGLEPGESYGEAAVREIREETGITALDLGPVVWLREGVLNIPHPVLMVEQYHLAWCDAVEPNRDGWDAAERRLIDDIRWWSLADLAATPDRIFPPGLANLLVPLLAGDLPSQPQRIPWD